MRLENITVILGITALAGCTSTSDTVKRLPTEIARDAYVSEIKIVALPDNVSPEFRGQLVSELESHLKDCARGSRPLRLAVTVTLFSPQNPALTILIGDSNKIKGTARLIDPSNEGIVGDYDIGWSEGWGGIVAAVAMAGPEGKMTHAFADEVCKRAFPKPIQADVEAGAFPSRLHPDQTVNGETGSIPSRLHPY